MLLALNLLLLGGAVLVLLGLVCDGIIIARFVPQPQLLVTPKPWGLRQLGLAVAVLAAVFLFSNAFYAALALHRRQEITALVPLIIPIELILRLALLAGFDTYFRRKQIQIRSALGFDSLTPAKAIGWGTAFALAIFPPVGVLIFATNAFCQLLHITPSQQPIVEFFLTTQSTPLLVTLVIFAVVVAPVFEEFFFRGFAYPALKQRFGIAPALLIVSAVFALNHLHAPSLLPLFVLAIGLGLAYELTGSLLVPVVMHAVFNFVTVLQVFYQRAHP
ncbi:MAG: CPBP family intramembrane glutamic endopeptidase [Verrucomicrobiota bacterium]